MICNNCEAAMRPHNSSLVDYPGTVMHSGLGQCGTCRTKARRAEAAKNPDIDHSAPMTLDQLAEATGFVRDYILDRRRRGIPTEGIRVRKVAAA